jgi:electron transfer flavoprotein alpha subunit
MRALAFVEHHGDVVRPGGLGVLSRAVSLDEHAGAVLVGGPEVKGLAAEVARCGAATVHLAEADALAPPLPQPRVDVLARVVDDGAYDTVLFSNSVLAADVAGGLAARLGAGLNWDLVDLVEDGAGDVVGRRLALADSVMVDVGWRTTPRIALFRPGSFEVVERPRTPNVESVAVVAFEDHSCVARIVDQVVQHDDGPSLEGAEVIVTGGMGLGGPEHLSLAEDLAAVLGGVVGATRAVVYAGWLPHSAQVGQTGKTVCPRLYVALGVSGAVQHKVGMQGAQTIVALNTDPRAPIFEFCDLAVVGDVHTIVPRLVDALRRRTGA